MGNVNTATGAMKIEGIDRLKKELDKWRPLPADVLGRVEQKLRLDANYHSNAIEGNSLTFGETRSLILHGLTAHGKPMRDHLDIEGHDAAVKAIEDAVKRSESINEVFIRNLHEVLLKEPYEIDAITLDGQRVKRLIVVGDYKAQPNNVRTSTGEVYHYTPPEQVKSAMGDLIDWYRKKEIEGEHPIIIAATFHYRFVRIHPFDDGNGRMARLLMNMILIRYGYTVAIIPIEERTRYIDSLERADKSENLTEFIAYIAGCCKYALSLYLRAARGEDIEEVEDIDKEIALFLKKKMSDTIEARAYADQVLYPFFSYCKEKIEKFSNLFGKIDIWGHPTIRNIDSTNFSFQLTEREDSLPETAFSISTRVSFRLSDFQGKKMEVVFLQIVNEADSNACSWDFSASKSTDGGGTMHRYFKREYIGRDVHVLKKAFNEILRGMMEKMTERPDH